MKKYFIPLFLLSSLFADPLNLKYNECDNILYYNNGMGVAVDSEKDAIAKLQNDIFQLRKFVFDNNDILNDTSSLIHLKVSPTFGQPILGEDGFPIWMAYKQGLLSGSDKGFTNNNYFSLVGYILDGNVDKPYFYEGSEQAWITIRDMVLNNESWKQMSSAKVSADPQLARKIKSFRDEVDILGHTVSLLGHSQGNFYSNLAYQNINDHLNLDRINVSGLASFDNFVAGTVDNSRKGAPAYVNDSNDLVLYPVSFDPSVLPSNVKNPPHFSLFNDPSIPKLLQNHSFINYITAAKSSVMAYTMLVNQINENNNKPSSWTISDDLLTPSYIKEGSNIFSEHIKLLEFGSSDNDKVFYTTILNGDNAGTPVLVKGSCLGNGVIEVNENGVLYELNATTQTIDASINPGRVFIDLNITNPNPDKDISIFLNKKHPDSSVTSYDSIIVSTSTTNVDLDNLEFGDYNLLVSVDNDIFVGSRDFSVTSDNLTPAYSFSLDMHYYPMSLSFLADDLRNNTWTINEAGKDKLFLLSMSTDVVDINGTLSGFEDLAEWTIVDGVLTIERSLFGSVLSLFEHRITSVSGSCYEVSSTETNSNWSNSYHMCRK